ncbi:ribosomal-protein-alanine acetyltransferase [Loktanella sp. D2R18]|uniref:GNAT family N-acetyltransferase n=1 Tax=Rhodobacterales TaxID=204455 RepID=UPI000DEA04EC|nr:MULTISPECIES: GNAT family N-acetyltransferase [Rhodobacterales]MDO6588712.1 GNAT family N-acetyltransferase [Yoonia sp. 1_MG-2023]RBW42049.1 ribosomal-protein-alanine acetyltransferase [Loktanella sp. D2R18]
MTPQELALLHAAAFTQTRAWSEAEFTTLLQQPGAILSAQEFCFALLRVTLDEAEVLTIATAPDQRRQGYAAQILSQAEASAQKSGATTVFLEVAEDNHAAKSLYTKAGYAQMGRRPNYYTPKDGAAIAALVLQKQL